MDKVLPINPTHLESEHADRLLYHKHHFISVISGGSAADIVVQYPQAASLHTHSDIPVGIRSLIAMRHNDKIPTMPC